jgi:hypothetical protein
VVALGTTAYKGYLISNSAQLLQIAAACMILVYIASTFLGQKGPVALLESNINKATKELEKKKKFNVQIYQAYLKKGETNKALSHLTRMNTKYALNTNRIKELETELSNLRRELRRQLPASVYERVSSAVTALMPLATQAIEAAKQVSTLRVQLIQANTASQIAITEAKTRQALALAAAKQAAVQQGVQDTLAPFRGYAAAAVNVAGVAGEVGTAVARLHNAAQPAVPVVKGAAKQAARFLPYLTEAARFFNRRRTPH